MKKVLCLLCAGLFSLALAGCGEPAKEEPKQTPEQKAAIDKQHEEALKQSKPAQGGGGSTTP